MNYLIIGDDDYIKEVETKQILSKFLSPDKTSLNYSVHDSASVDGAITALGTMPFLAEKRVALIKDLEDLTDKDFTNILAYLEKSSKTGVLLLAASNVFKNTKYYNRFRELVEVINLEKPTPSALEDWIRTFLKKENIEISPGAIMLLIELKGLDIENIKMELEKLIMYTAGKRIELGDVERLVGRSTVETVFKLGDAIGVCDAKRTFHVLGDLYADKKEPHEIIGYLSWYIRTIQRISLFASKKMTLNEIAGELGYSYNYVRNLINQSKNYSAKRICEWIEFLIEADRSIKLGLKQPRLALEMLVTSLLKS